jgi:hypothetical protein
MKQQKKKTIETRGEEREKAARSATPLWIHHEGQRCCMDPPPGELAKAVV